MTGQFIAGGLGTRFETDRRRMNSGRAPSSAIGRGTTDPPIPAARKSCVARPCPTLPDRALCHRRVEGGAMRLAVVGCGYWGAKHIRVLRQLSAVRRVVAVDPRAECRTELARSAGIDTIYPDLDAALPHVDAVVIAAPPSAHSGLALQALAAGRHVLVEKPMTTSVASAQRLVEEATGRGLTLMVGHTFEYHAAVCALRDLIESGELG